jgi:hypothetical protein
LRCDSEPSGAAAAARGEGDVRRDVEERSIAEIAGRLGRAPATVNADLDDPSAAALG